MAGTVDLARRGYAGVEPCEGSVSVEPQLPQLLTTLRYSVLVGESWLDVSLADGQLTLSNRPGNETDVKVNLRGRKTVLGPGQSIEAPL
jgi:trehalose/maltose hydrolase-like predicted phosphorylase